MKSIARCRWCWRPPELVGMQQQDRQPQDVHRVSEGLQPVGAAPITLGPAGVELGQSGAQDRSLQTGVRNRASSIRGLSRPSGSPQHLDQRHRLLRCGAEAGVGKSRPLASKPGPDTLVVRPAITRIATSTQGLRFYEWLPVTLVAAGVSAATGIRDQTARSPPRCPSRTAKPARSSPSWCARARVYRWTMTSRS